jgi:ABC-type cobalamin/Fe3+-siderophores transport system ATPase subunit
MILNIVDNGKVLKDNRNVQLNDFVVLTGENGSGKTQLLQFIHQFAHGIYNEETGMTVPDESGEHQLLPLRTDDGRLLREVVYALPGLRDQSQENNPNYSLITAIAQEWQQLEPFVAASTLIRHKTFSNVEEEIREVNNALKRLVGQAHTASSQHVTVSAKEIAEYQFTQLKNVAQACNKDVFELNFLDFIAFYKIPLNIFSAALDLLFHQFHLKAKNYPSLTQGVRPPWEIFNEILDRARFKYQAEYYESQNPEIPHPVKLRHKVTGKQIEFQNLSSGETTIMALIFALYNSSNDGHFPEVLLLDEPDAHLHPSLAQIFLEVIEDVLVKRHDVKVIMTTHSPSTVALAPDEAVYCMDLIAGCPRKQDRKSAVSILSSGLASVTIEEGSMGIVYNIKNTSADKHVLFTEGITDKMILEIAWHKLYPGKEPLFYIQDCFSANVLGNLFSQGNQAPDGIFYQFENKKLMALFDFDAAGFAQWNNKGAFSKIIQDDPRKCLTRTNGKNGFMMLLPVPDIPEITAQVISFENDTYGDRSSLTIECLLFDQPALKKYFRESPMPGGGVAHVFNSNKSKRDFAGELSHLNAVAFKNFVQLFDNIDRILTYDS